MTGRIEDGAGIQRMPDQQARADWQDGRVGDRAVRRETPGDMRGQDQPPLSGHRRDTPLLARRVAVAGPSGHPPAPTRPEGSLTTRIGARLATFDALVEKMGGHRPKADIKIGPITLWRHSIAFKAVRDSLQDYQTLLARPLPAQPDRTAALADLAQALDAVARGARDYIDHHTGSSSRTQQIAAMRDVLQQVELEHGLLEELEYDPAADTVAGDVSLGGAMQAKRAGIAYADCAFRDFPDDALDRLRCDETFGSGGANQVSLLVYRNGGEYVFKPEPFTDTDSALVLPRKLGIDTDHPHYGNRNIAALNVDRLLGTQALCEARITEHEGTLGLLMDRAVGASPVYQYSRPATPEEIEAAERMRQVVDPEDYDDLLREMNLGLDREGNIIGRPIERRNVLARAADRVTAATRPDLVRQLTGLEWSDCLSGQADRHGMNYMVAIGPDGTPRITAIDNDLCFGARSVSVPEPSDATGVKNTGLPQLVDRALFERLSRLDFERDVAPTLEGLLTDEEIAATGSRLTEMQAHLRTLAPRYVVDDWAAWRDPLGRDAMTFLAENDRPNLWQRDFAPFEG